MHKLNKIGYICASNKAQNHANHHHQPKERARRACCAAIFVATYAIRYRCVVVVSTNKVDNRASSYGQINRSHIDA